MEALETQEKNDPMKELFGDFIVSAKNMLGED